MSKPRNQYFVCKDNILTLEQLFEQHRAKVIVRRTNRDGSVDFHLFEKYNPRWKNGRGWKLGDRETIIQAIDLAKRYNIKKIREEL